MFLHFISTVTGKSIISIYLNVTTYQSSVPESEVQRTLHIAWIKGRDLRTSKLSHGIVYTSPGCQQFTISAVYVILDHVHTYLHLRLNYELKLQWNKTIISRRFVTVKIRSPYHDHYFELLFQLWAARYLMTFFCEVFNDLVTSNYLDTYLL